MDFPWDNSSQEKPSFVRNFQQELDQKLQLQNDLASKMQLQEGPETSWKRDFGANLFSDSSNQLGTFKSFPTSGFNYSQKNFHTSNGNLYSIFSPFQSRKSITKPSFLRGHVTSNETGLKDVGGPLFLDHPSGSATFSGAGLRKSRSKLKFHHQNVPPQYRKNFKETDASSNFHSYKSYSHHKSSMSSSFKSQSIFSENKDKHFFEDNDSLSMDDLFKDKETKKDDDPFVAIDLSSTSDKFFDKDLELGKRSNRLRKSRACRSFFEDSDDEDEPLNLCIADQLKESQLTFLKSTNEKVRKMQRNFFANRSPTTSIFRSPTIDFNQEKQAPKFERVYRKEKDDEAMDLSFTEGNPKERPRNTAARSASAGSMGSEKEKVKKVPHISEMLENMTIWDDHSRSPNPPRDHLSTNSDVCCGVWTPEINVEDKEKCSFGKVQEKLCTGSKNDPPEVKLVTGSLPTNYYVFIPSPFIQVLDKKEPVATTTTIANDPEKVVIYVPSENKTQPSTAKQAKESVDIKEKFNQQTDDNVNICKFKLVKGQQPSLEEKKNFFVPLPRSSKRPMEEHGSARGKTESGTKADHFRTYKIHVGLQDDMGRKLSSPRKIRRRSRKALARDKLEATFREQGFLIKTQQVSSAEGSVYCKFRQLKKFTRYLFKSWRNYLPKDLEQMSKDGVKPAVTLSMPDIPGAYKQMYSIPTARSASATFDSASLAANYEPTVSENGNKLMVSNSMPLICQGSSNASDSLSASVSPCPSVCSLTHTLSSSSVP